MDVVNVGSLIYLKSTLAIHQRTHIGEKHGVFSKWGKTSTVKSDLKRKWTQRRIFMTVTNTGIWPTKAIWERPYDLMSLLSGVSSQAPPEDIHR